MMRLSSAVVFTYPRCRQLREVSREGRSRRRQSVPQNDCGVGWAVAVRQSYA